MEQVLAGHYSVLLKKIRELHFVDDDNLSELEETYKWLTHYFQEGVDDPERKQILQGVGQRLLDVVTYIAAQYQKVEQLNCTRSRSLIWLIAMGFTEPKIAELTEKLIAQEHTYSVEFFENLDRLFDLLWTSPQLSSSSEQSLIEYLQGDKFSPLVAQSIVGGLFVGLMEYFDAAKIRLLLAFYSSHSDAMVRGATLAALLFAGRRHQEALEKLYPDLVREVNGVITQNQSLLETALKVSQVSYKTTENHQIFQEKILPEMKSMTQKLNDMMGYGFINLRIEEELEKGRMDDEQLQEMEQLMTEIPEKFAIIQDKEQDSTFHMVSQLKGFAFFSKVSHWFMRFDEHYPELSPENAALFMRVQPMMNHGNRMVSSDLYSYALAPVWGQVNSKISEELLGQPLPELPMLPPPTEEDGIKELIFGAYRFYQLSSLAHTMVNPFDLSPYLLDGPFISQRGSISEESLLRLASAMVSMGQYGAAGWTYERLLNDYQTSTAEVWRGMAVASLMRENHKAALQQLQKAVALEGRTMMTVQKIAEIMGSLGDTEGALVWLEESEKEIDNYRLPLMRAKLLNKLGRHEEALKVAYKADYLAVEPIKEVKALLIDLLLRLEKPAEASEVVERMSESDQDYFLLKGVTALAIGDRKSGFEHIQQWLSTSDEELFSQMGWIERLKPYYSDADRSLIIDIIMNMQE